MLSPAERAEVTLAMLEDVLDACTAQLGWETWVISGSPEALEAARPHGARGVPEKGSTLLEAVRQAEIEVMAASETPPAATAVGDVQLAVILADLPLLTSDALSQALDLPGAVVAAPATSDGGTNLLLRRPPTAIAARFGRSSYRRHRAGAYRRGLSFSEAVAIELGFDLDRPADLLTLLASDARTRTRSACRRMGLAARLRVGA
jgi:2-phospho-L-lactate guanylyltransferase